MIVKIPHAYASVVERIRDTQPLYAVADAGEHYELRLGTGFAFDRLALGLTEQELIKFFKAVKVVGGRKKKEKNHIIFLPRRVIKTTVRFSEDEAVLVKEIARKRGVPVADYIRTSVLEDAFKEVKQTWTGRQ